MLKEKKESYLGKLRSNYERNTKIKEQLDNGRPLGDIAKMFGVSLGVVTYLKNNYDVVQAKLENRINKYKWIEHLYKEGYQENEIADIEGMTKQNVSRILKQLGVNRMDGGKSVVKKRNMEKVSRLAEKGYLLQDITRITGLEENLVRQYAYIGDLNIKTETTEKVKKLKDDVVTLRDQGYYQADIAEKLDISQNYVSKILLMLDKRSKGSPAESKIRDEQIYMEYLEGKSIKELSDKWDTGLNNIRRILYKFNK